MKVPDTWCFLSSSCGVEAMSLVTGYDSDSDDDAVVITPQAVLPTPPPAQLTSSKGLSSLLPPPKHDKPAPPSATSSNNKRRADKLQIRIGSLKDAEDEGVTRGDVDSVTSAKRPKVGGGGHGLFSMLPAPSNKLPGPPTRKSQAAEREDGHVNIFGISDASAGAITLREPTQDDASGARKTKGNDDFRAMLGLKPSKLAASLCVKEADAKVSVASSLSVLKGALKLPAVTTPDDSVSSAPAGQDFFSLSSGSASSSKDGKPITRSSISVTLAPKVTEDHPTEMPASSDDAAQDPYEGWQQGPDGAWFPVTPAAHAQYQRHLATSADDHECGLRMAEADAGTTRIDPNRIHDTDVNAGQTDWLARPAKDTAAETKADSLDQRYALAAASVAQPGQARVDVPVDAAGDAAKHGDKATNMRARRKGQLSSLIAQADENREKLEDRWSRGRAARSEAQKRYGF